MKTKKSSKSPTQRTLAQLRKQGYLTAITEHWNQWAKIRQDLFGFIDLLYLTGKSIVAVQCTSGSNHAARRTKILGSEAAMAWIDSGGLIEVHSWELQGAAGTVKKWTCRKEEIVKADFSASCDPIPERNHTDA